MVLFPTISFFQSIGHEIVGKIHVKQIYEIAKVKRRDPHMKRFSLWTVCKQIVGSCKSMGVEVEAG
jgi:large subunit ribosomal protein L11